MFRSFLETGSLAYLYTIESPLGSWSVRLLELSDLTEVGLSP